ncbi:MAG: hypothetical protein JO029_13600, partial [Candidatus Eremiobacteraeota bacterium]|nr:hypothetical protein [Candidatus Eremiobacteraeota bacterium]
MRRFARLPVIAASLALAACGGNGAAGIAIPPQQHGFAVFPATKATPIPLRVRQKAFEAIATLYARLDQKNPVSDAKAILKLVKTMPVFATSGSDAPATVWAVFTDGRSLLILNDEIPEPSSSSSPTAHAAAPAETRPAAGIAPRPMDFSQPGGDADEITPGSAIELVAEERAFPNSRNIQNISRAMSDVGITATAADLTVDHAIAMGRVTIGLLYDDSHGGIGRDRSGAPVYELATDSAPTPRLELKYAAELNAGRVDYVMDTHSEIDGKKHRMVAGYAITTSFAQHYWHFASNSLAWISACHSAQNDPAVQAFRRA